VAAYANWLGLLRGDLQASFAKGDATQTRRLAHDRSYVAPDGRPFTLPGRSVLLVRNVGHLMTTPAVRLADGQDAPEGLVDAVVTSLIGLVDVQGRGRHRNSRSGSIYIVKPKMHGPAECAFANDVLDAVEDLLGLARHTIKIGVMDEERRTSVNLAACIHAVRHRVMFINTGFLDRTGDEIHTAMRAGPMLRKAQMKATPWIAAYEDRNVQIGLACGLAGKARSARACGPCPIAWPTCWRKRPCTRRLAPTLPGCLRPPPPCCTPRIITASMWPPARQRAWPSHWPRWPIC
jgi:malate synthase